MYDFKPTEGSEKKWFKDGKLMLVLRAFRKRFKRGGRTTSKTVVRLMTPEEYAKLTEDAGKR